MVQAGKGRRHLTRTYSQLFGKRTRTSELDRFQTIEQLRELLPVYEQEIEESNYVPAWQRQMIYISRRFVDWLADEFIGDVQVEGCYLRKCNMNLAARELYVQIYTPFPAQEVRGWFGV